MIGGSGEKRTLRLAEQGGISLTATDMDLLVVEQVEAEVSQPGAATAPAHTLYDVVRKLPEGSIVALEQAKDGPELTLRAGRSTFDLPCLPAADFPSMTDEGLSHSFGIAAGVLRRLFDRTRFAISTEETRYYLNGIHMHAVEDGGFLRAVATDGHRLARVEAPLPEGAAGMPPIIVPRKTVAEIRKLIDDIDVEEIVEVALSNARIRFKVGRAVLRSRLIDGTFPDYERVIPSGNDKLLVVPTKDLSEAVDRVATIATDKSRAVKLSIAKGRLTLSAVSPDAGRAVEELDVDYAAEPLEIGFNARYILDMSAQIEGGEIEFAVADSGSPTLVRDRKDDSALYVLMPMRV
jgi:DNA polymerase-3 subunit beta